MKYGEGAAEAVFGMMSTKKAKVNRRTRQHSVKISDFFLIPRMEISS
jgi:hypothetical protein